MLLIETELGNTTNKLSERSLREPETGTDYWDDPYEYKQYGIEDSDEDEGPAAAAATQCYTHMGMGGTERQTWARAIRE